MKNDDLPVIPSAYNQLTKVQVDSNREVIKEYEVAGGDGVTLTEKQLELRVRWVYADQKIRANIGKLSRGEIAELIKNEFGVSLCTAKADMVNAEYVYSSSAPIHKAHRIGIRIEILEKQILKAHLASNHKAAAAYEKVLQKYIEMYPDTTPVEVPKTLIFNFDVEKLIPRVYEQSEAEAIIDQQLEKNKLIDSLSEDIDEEGEFENE